MTAPWKLEAEAKLLSQGTPAVLTTGMLLMIATSGRADAPSMATFQRWRGDLVLSGKLREVIKGVYLNRMGHGDVSPAAAAGRVRSRSVVSLAWVLEQAGITNNFGDTITCVIPTDPTWVNPQIGDRLTAAGTFRFFAMPAHLVDERSGSFSDIRDPRFDYPRASPEKALLDWIYLGGSVRSRMTLPPFDLDVESLNQARLRRVAKQMGITEDFRAWSDRRARYQADEDVRENSAVRMRF